MSSPSRLRTRGQVVAAWLTVLAVLGVALGAWGHALGMVVSVQDPAATAPRDPTFGARHSVITSTIDPRTGQVSNCIYGSSGESGIVVMSAQTGTVLSEAQVAHCTN